MRPLIAWSSLLLVLSPVRAQEQENKLIDRLLRPQTELQNSAQNKKFIGDRRLINKQAVTSTFYVQEKSNSKKFSGNRDFSSWQFNARSSSEGEREAATTSRNEIANSRTNYSTRTAAGVRATHDARRTAANRVYAAQRPFLGKGKSQKALSQHDTPLTIEQVRELLNKNK